MEEGGDDVKSSWPLWAGLHTCYNGRYKVSQYSNVELITKADLSSDRGLQLSLVKLESLVIVNQNVAVNTFSGLVHTARQAMKVDCTLSKWANRKEAAYQGDVSDWG